MIASCTCFHSVGGPDPNEENPSANITMAPTNTNAKKTGPGYLIALNLQLPF
jgi:hypothetical protein